MAGDDRMQMTDGCVLQLREGLDFKQGFVVNMGRSGWRAERRIALDARAAGCFSIRAMRDVCSSSGGGEESMKGDGFPLERWGWKSATMKV